MLPHRRWFCLPGMALFAAQAGAQITLESVRALPGDVPQVEIVTSAPVTPAILQLEGPPRLVVDLPNTEFRGEPERIAVDRDPIHAIRVDEHQNSPPVTRVVVDLTQSLPYGTQTQGTRFIVSFPAAARGAVKSTSEGALPAPVPLGRVTFSGSTVLAGSAVTAGSDTAILRLGRGGEVRVCPGTTVSVTPSPNGHDMLLGMNTGGVELHYALAASSPASADSVMTPDFRIVLAGPGEFDAAIHADSRREHLRADAGGKHRAHQSVRTNGRWGIRSEAVGTGDVSGWANQRSRESSSGDVRMPGAGCTDCNARSRNAAATTFEAQRRPRERGRAVCV